MGAIQPDLERSTMLSRTLCRSSQQNASRAFFLASPSVPLFVRRLVLTGIAALVVFGASTVAAHQKTKSQTVCG